MKCLIILFFILSTNALAKTILFLGDSLTAGYGIDQENSYPYLLETLLKKEGISIELINASESGATTSVGLSRFRWVLKRRIDILVLALGGNDGLRGIDVNATKENLQKIMTLAKKNNVSVLLAGMMAPKNMGTLFTEKFDNLFKDLGKNNEIFFMPFLLKDVAGLKKMNIGDGIHPNETGHQIIAKNMYPILKKAIQGK
ncbi:MAG: arylesterase [Halobacteriovoraceae bacterium]|nr:arylesterase [Halobacteriovoraceae bacterium]